MSVDVSVFSDVAMQTRDLGKPDNESVVWPMPRDPKLDTVAILRKAFDLLGLDDVVVSKAAAFTAAALENEDHASVPYVTVLRTGDVEQRIAIDNLVGTFIGGDDNLIDQGRVDQDTGIPIGGPLLQDGDTASVYGTNSLTTIEITISDKDSPRADQMYVIVKTIMRNALREFQSAGYLDVKRTNGQDAASIEMNESSPNVVHNRSLTYSFLYPETTVGVESAIAIVKQTLIAEPSPSSARITTNL